MTSQQPQCFLERRYTKTSSFEAVQVPFEVPLEKGTSEYQLETKLNYRALKDNQYEVVLMLDVTMKSQEQLLYKATLQQVGIFVLNTTSPQTEFALNTLCPTLLYPYAAERLDQVVIQGAFPPLSLAPLNFEQLFLDKLQKQKDNVAEVMN